MQQDRLRGRIGLHAPLIDDNDIKRLIYEHACVAEIFAAAEGGMRARKVNNMEKIMMGFTDIKMARSVCTK